MTKRNDSSPGNRHNRSGETVTDAQADGQPPPDESPTPESGEASHQRARQESICLVEHGAGLDLPLAGSLKSPIISADGDGSGGSRYTVLVTVMVLIAVAFPDAVARSIAVGGLTCPPRTLGEAGSRYASNRCERTDMESVSQPCQQGVHWDFRNPGCHVGDAVRQNQFITVDHAPAGVDDIGHIAFPLPARRG